MGKCFTRDREGETFRREKIRVSGIRDLYGDFNYLFEVHSRFFEFSFEELFEIIIGSSEGQAKLQREKFEPVGAMNFYYYYVALVNMRQLHK